MDETGHLLWVVLFGAIGLGYLTYGRRQGALLPLFIGITLILARRLRDVDRDPLLRQALARAFPPAA
ncbi:MAG: hypothetical protein P8045_02760 [Candidatus Thiodiazotropha sp.]